MLIGYFRGAQVQEHQMLLKYTKLRLPQIKKKKLKIIYIILLQVFNMVNKNKKLIMTQMIPILTLKIKSENQKFMIKISLKVNYKTILKGKKKKYLWKEIAMKTGLNKENEVIRELNTALNRNN